MTNTERNAAGNPDEAPSYRQLDIDVPSLETALQSPPETLLDWNLGPGVAFRLGDDRRSALELYGQVVRVRLPHGELALPRREAQVALKGVVFEDPERFFLSVGPRGDVLFQYSPPSPGADAATDDEATVSQRPAPVPPPERAPQAPSPVPVREAKEKPKSERYVGRMGEVKSHRTKQGKLVAEVEITVSDPDRPGASRLVKFAAFGENAEALERDYQPGQLVTAVGIPHELRRRNKDGREWTERQLYFVQLPKPR